MTGLRHKHEELERVRNPAVVHVQALGVHQDGPLAADAPIHLARGAGLNRQPLAAVDLRHVGGAVVQEVGQELGGHRVTPRQTKSPLSSSTAGSCSTQGHS